MVSPGASSRELRNLAGGAKAAQAGLKLLQQIEGGLRGLGGVGFFFSGDADVEIRRHGAMMELVDVSHTVHFGSGDQSRMRTPGRSPK